MQGALGICWDHQVLAWECWNKKYCATALQLSVGISLAIPWTTFSLPNEKKQFEGNPLQIKTILQIPAATFTRVLITTLLTVYQAFHPLLFWTSKKFQTYVIWKEKLFICRLTWNPDLSRNTVARCSKQTEIKPSCSFSLVRAPSYLPINYENEILKTKSNTSVASCSLCTRPNILHSKPPALCQLEIPTSIFIFLR